MRVTCRPILGCVIHSIAYVRGEHETNVYLTCVGVECVHTFVCVCEDYPALGIEGIVSTCVLTQCSGRVWRTWEERGAALVGVFFGGVRFHSTMQHIWEARAKLKFPRLKKHIGYTNSCMYVHLDKALFLSKHPHGLM